VAAGAFPAYADDMPAALAPCPSCARHVRVSEAACPFCRAPLDVAPRIVPGATQRLTRAAAYAFTATLATTGAAASLEACGGTTTPETQDSGNAPVYGAPAYGAQPVEAGAPVDAAKDGAGDGAADAADSAQDSGAADTGPFDAGGSALYGAPAVPGRDIDPPSTR
jgi:hypothetical protein